MFDPFDGDAGFLGWLLEASLHGAALAAVVLLVRAAAGERIPARWRVWLWGLVLVRLALPMGLPSSVSLFNVPRWAGMEWSTGPSESAAPPSIPIMPPTDRAALAGRSGAARPATAAFGGSAAAGSEDAAAGWSAARPPGWKGVLLACWGAGVAAVTLGVLAAHLRMRGTLAHSRQIRDGRVIDAVERARADLALRTPVTVAKNPRIGAPIIVGFIRPSLLLPSGLAERLDDGELRGIALHELAHVKRRDIAAGWLAAAVLAVHWFNPLAWAAVGAIRRDRELACDAMALEHMHEDERPAYGRTLLKLIENCPRRGAIPGLAAIVDHRGDLRRRVLMIARHRRPSAGASLGAAALVGLLGVVGLTDASEGQAAGRAGQGRAALAQPQSEGESDFRLYTSVYTPEPNGRIRMPQEAYWMVMPAYHGVDAEGNEVIDERITMVLVDEANSFWPLIVKLSTPEAEALLQKLTAALEKIGDGGIREPMDASIFTKGLRRGEHGMIELRGVVLNAFPVGAGEGELVAITLGPPRAQEPPFAARMGVDLAQSLATQLQDQILAKRGERAGAPARRGLRADVEAAEALRRASARIGNPDRLSASDYFVYTQGLELNEFGVAELPHGATFRVLPEYSGETPDGRRVVDKRITLVLQDPERAFWPAICWLSLKDAKALRDKIGDAMGAGGGAGGKTERVRPMIGTQPYQILEHGIMPLPEHVRIDVIPMYRGVRGEEVIVDDRATVVIADPQERFWAVIVPLDLEDASALEEALDEQIRAREE